MVGLGFSMLLAIAAILGCGSSGPGFLDLGGKSFVPRFAYVPNGDPECGGDCSPLDISAYTVNATTGALTPIPGSPFSTAAFNGDRFFVDMDPAGHFLFVTTRGENFVQVFSINQTTGVLTEVPGSPFDSGGNDAYEAEINETGKFLYVSNSLSGTIGQFSIASTGALAPIAPPVQTQGDPFHLSIAPNGKFLYAAVNTDGGYLIEGYSVNSSTGALTELAGSPFNSGKCPEALETDFSSQFLIVPNRCDGTVSVFKIDPTTGALTGVPGSPFAAGESPVNFAEAQIGSQTYIGVNNATSANVSVYSFNTTTGVLTAVSGSPFGLGLNSPNWIAVGGSFGYVVDANAVNIRVATIDANGKPTEISGSPVTTGGLTYPTQIRLVY